MNDKSDQLAKGLRQSLSRTLLCLAAGALCVLPTLANDFNRGPLLLISSPNPLAGCDDGLHPGEANSIKAAGEPFVAVNPANPKNIVAAWIGGYAQSIIAGVSFDGGKRWQQVAIPGITVCSGGPSLGAADPWVSFAPNGDCYVLCHPFAPGAITVNKSSDGGLHWSAPIFLADVAAGPHDQADKPSLTADPTDARLVYAVWNRDDSGNRGQALFTRTTNGGQTWEPVRVIYDPGAANNGTLGHIINVLPGGTLVDVFTEFKFSDDGTHKGALLSVIRSTDQGQSWSAPIRAATITVFSVADVDTGVPVVNSSSCCPNPAVAMDSNNGSLYVAWEDTRFSSGQYSSIAFAMSTDGGLTWSTPIQVNRTPTTTAPGNRQAFVPDIAVAANGTIAVTYYDFRFNDANPGLPTDYWLVHCHPSAATPATNPANWGNELRLSDASFDLERGLSFGGAYFLGDYVGLASAGNDFVAAFTQSDPTNLTSIFFRRVGP